jgi:DnaJ-class molecular chaperone
MTRMGRHMKPLGEAVTVKRPCLKCKETFDSEGPCNRLCDKCRGYGGIDVLVNMS